MSDPTEPHRSNAPDTANRALLPDQETPLETRLKRMIATGGPISVADYMTLCLTDPEHGYYTNAQPIGQEGDFITAPEISQMFGEIIGIFMLSVWQQSGRPSPFHLVELGPGRGTLMRDMLRAITTDEAAARALHIHLVEISPDLRQEQQTCLADLPLPAEWHGSLKTLPDAPLFFVANEFFDCLPVHQWIVTGEAVHERVVGLDKEGALAFGVGPIRAYHARSDQAAPEKGAILEKSPASEAIMADIAGRLALRGGAGLFIDYGYVDAGFGDTLQALKAHGHADPLALPGKQDLTAHVNFSALADCARAELAKAEGSANPLTVPDPVTQGTFLLNLGLLERAGQLGTSKSHREQEAIQSAVERLAGPDQMGNLFKTMAILPQAVTIPPFSVG
ncbi:SAM-dependent methyltransferase, MidA family [Cohaesibacter sp. ES.047]|uniref:class I SAM-dependent methyltransferase n=1 Tax=Cohaesibacter sp. ES.047 TaxID=1798205 RepID=UPI000BB79E9E|nr:class I SAM-dependent methyltransferase [Cohaesibacter sp. ES.047]SNY91500.1 SAM-dependent methyltransferase, MidA family [Cohaesibacter sp. ES.047]